MEENEKRDINMVAMEVIMNAGDGRDKIDEALAAMAEGKLDELRRRYPNLDITSWTRENRVQM